MKITFLIALLGAVITLTGCDNSSTRSDSMSSATNEMRQNAPPTTAMPATNVPSTTDTNVVPK